jgi:hypothetical protein
MTIFNPIETVQRTSLQPTTGPQLVLAGSITAVMVFAALVQQALPQAALLPATCAALFVLAAVVALLAWWRPVPARQFTYWDASGVLTLIGVFACAMVEPGDMVRLLADER